MPKKRRITVSTKKALREAERQATSMALPTPVHHRLDELVQLAGAANTNRAEIVAMLIAEAVRDTEDLEQRVLRYRKLTVGDVMAPTEGDDVVIDLHGPGRRKGDAAS